LKLQRRAVAGHNLDSLFVFRQRTPQISIGTIDMKLTNDSYVILIGTKNFTERYYRDKTGWLKVSARGRTFRMTAEQVLNHVLPALAGIKPNVTIKVEHHAPLFPNERSA
jgi:hypothetical protein